VTYQLKKKATWSIELSAYATKKTPLLLSGHHYWNLEGYQETQDLVGHHAQFNSSKIIATDGLLLPSGSYINVKGTPLDFRTAKSIGGSINATESAHYCGNS
jgi:aldose 1-epimerase